MRELVSPATRFNIVVLCLGVLLVLLVRLFENLTGIMAMLAGSLLLTYVLLAPIRLLEASLRRLIPKAAHLSPGVRRGFAILAVYLLFLASCTVIVIRVVPPLALQVKDFAHEMPGYVSEIDQSLIHLETTITHGDPATLGERLAVRPPIPFRVRAHQEPKVPQPVRLLSQTARLSMDKLREFSRQAGRVLLNIGADTINGLVYTLTSLMFAFYLLKDGRTLRNGLADLLPFHREIAMARFLHRVHRQLYNLVKAQALMGLLSGGLVYTLMVIFGIKYALLLGVFFGLMSILPVLGPWLGLLPMTLILPLSGHGVCLLVVAIAVALFHTIKAYWLWPRVLHARYRVIHPVVFIIALLLCIQMVGLVGFLLVFPLSGILAVTLDMVKAHHESVSVTVSEPWGMGSVPSPAELQEALADFELKPISNSNPGKWPPPSDI